MDARSWAGRREDAIPDFEDEHRRWKKLLAELTFAMRLRRGHKVVGKTLEALSEYSRHHFQEEESFLADIDYPYLEEQIRQHEFFSNWVEQAKAELGGPDQHSLAIDVLEMMKVWLSTHIQVIDGKYVDFILERAGKAN